MNSHKVLIYIKNQLSLLFQRFKKEDISLMEDEKFLTLIKDLGKEKEIQSGHLKCSFCSTTLTYENISGFIIKNNQYVFFCNSAECITRAKKHLEENYG